MDPSWELTSHPLLRSRLLGLNSRKLNLWDDASVHIFIVRIEGKHTHIPGNSALMWPFWDGENIRNPNSKAMARWPPTFGDKVWSQIESPGRLEVKCLGRYCWLFRNSAYHLGYINPCTSWDKPPINWLAGFLPSTVFPRVLTKTPNKSMATIFPILSKYMMTEIKRTTWICLFDAWKKFQKSSPKWWLIDELPWYKIKNHQKNKSKKMLFFLLRVWIRFSTTVARISWTILGWQHQQTHQIRVCF